MTDNNAPVSAAAAEADRVVKRQKLCSTKFSSTVDNLLDLVNSSRVKLDQNPGETAEVIETLKRQITQLNVSSDLHDQTKQLHGAIGKLGKALEKAFVPDISKAHTHRPISFDADTLNQVIAEHLFHEGKFTVGEQFIAEAGVANGEALRRPYEAMHKVLTEIHAYNLEPALQWVEEHQQQLAKQPQAVGFEFKLYRLSFLRILNEQGHAVALQYARQHFPRFQSTQMPEIQRLMGSLCYTRRQNTSPYSDLNSPAQWNDMACDFARQCCGILGQAYESPLLVCVAAGSVALPTLLKLASKVTGQHLDDFRKAPQLTVDLELGNEFIFHSTFACPVSREQSTPENPPQMLPCGHVLCKQSILKIARSQVRPFKCPYCPVEATPQNCKQIHFPDLAVPAS